MRSLVVLAGICYCAALAFAAPAPRVRDSWKEVYAALQEEFPEQIISLGWELGLVGGFSVRARNTWSDELNASPRWRAQYYDTWYSGSGADFVEVSKLGLLGYWQVWPRWGGKTAGGAVA